MSEFGEIQLGLPVLSTDCGLSEEELRQRIKAEIPPETAEEYLARVSLEAKSFPRIVQNDSYSSTKEVNTNLKSKRKSSSWIPPKKIPKLELHPSKRQEIKNNFIEIREYLSYWEEKFVENEKKRKDLLKVEFPTSLERIQWVEFFDKVPPLLHVIFQMDNVDVIRGIKHITKAIELENCENDFQVSHPRCAWLFSLLARLDTPFTDDVGSTLKRLLRSAATARENAKDDSEITPNTLLRCLLEEYFGAGDNQDD